MMVFDYLEGNIQIDYKYIEQCYFQIQTTQLNRTLVHQYKHQIARIMEAEKERYWCYSCEQHFEASQSPKGCSHCQSEAVELAPNHNDPASFEIYQVEQPASQPPQANPSQPHNHNVMPTMNMTVFPGGMAQSFQIGAGMMPQFQQSPTMQMNWNLGNTINRMDEMYHRGGVELLMNSLLGQTNLSPTPLHQISRLKTTEQVGECPICQEEEEGRKGYELPCGHAFHVECLGPWLQRTNTCPSCRQRI